MPAEYCKKNLGDFHEADKQQNNILQSSFSQVKESELEQRLNLRLSRQRIVTWSSSSSSLSTDSLFSFIDSSSMPRNYKTTGIMFGNLDRVLHDPDVDPEPYACYNCWHFDHECHNCPKVKCLYCRNCGRYGVAVEECPRCARAYFIFFKNLKKNYNALYGGIHMQELEEENKLIDYLELDMTQDRADKCWDGFVEEGQKSFKGSFSNSLQKIETGYQLDDWDDYQSPRVNLVEKSSQVYSLIATEAEVAKFKDDNWDDCEVDVNTTSSVSLIIPEETAKYEDEFRQEACNDLWPSIDEKSEFVCVITSENKAENESECWSNHENEIFKSSWQESVINSTSDSIIDNKVKNEVESWSDCNEYDFKNCQKDSTTESNAASLIPGKKSSLEDQYNTWNDLKVQDVFRNIPTTFITEFQEQSLIDLENKKVRHEEEEWSDLEAYKSLPDSCCEDFETDNFIIPFNSKMDEDYWTDFDDDYQSLQASFAEDYKSLNTTVDDEADCTNILPKNVLKNKEKSGFYENLDVTVKAGSNELFSFIKNENINDHLLTEQRYEKKIHPLNSLENSIDSHSNNEDTDGYEDVIVDEDTRSEPLLFAGYAVQEFLKLLDSLKHLPIHTQNLAVLHFISKHKEQSWQRQISTQ